MPRLNNIKVVSSELKTKGKGQHGPWELYKVKIDDSDWKDIQFGYFLSGDKTSITEGMELDYLEYEEKVEGKYINYTITKLGLKEAKPLPKPQETGSSSGGYNRTSLVVQEFDAWKESLPTHHTGGTTFGDFINWKTRSMFYAYGKDLTLKLLELLAWSKTKYPRPEAIAALNVYFAETLFKASTGHKDTLQKMRGIYDQLLVEMEQLEASITQPEPTTLGGEKPADKPKPRGKQKPEEPSQDSEPENGNEPISYTKEEAHKEAAQWVFKATEINNLPHLENWWKKMCGSPERKAIEASDKAAWEGITKAYQLRKEQLLAEKESGNFEEPSQSNDGDMF